MLEYDWGEPLGAAVALLTSGWPALSILWELWPEHREEHVAMWCEEAKTDPWLWDEVWGFIDHALYCAWSRPPAISEFARCPRPANPGHRLAKPGPWLRLAAIETKLAEQVRSANAARLLRLEAFAAARRLKDRAEKLAWDVPETGEKLNDLSLLRLAALSDLGLELDESTVRRRFISGRERLQGLLAFAGP